MKRGVKKEKSLFSYLCSVFVLSYFPSLQLDSKLAEFSTSAAFDEPAVTSSPLPPPSGFFLFYFAVIYVYFFHLFSPPTTQHQQETLAHILVIHVVSSL